MIGPVRVRLVRYRARRASGKAADAFYADATRSTVLYVVDTPGWAHDRKAANLIRCLADEFDGHIVYERFVRPTDIERADVVVVFSWKQLATQALAGAGASLRAHPRLAVGVTSHPQGDERARMVAAIDAVATVAFVNSRLLHEDVAGDLGRPVHETPNGVDTAFFGVSAARTVATPMRVGWAGSLTNHGDNRGYHDVLVPAVDELDGAVLVTAARETTWRSADEMRRWYDDIDVYACASRHEGTPNPCLEAAASGVPVVTTAVGNMPEFVEPGTNGLLVERSVDAFADALRSLVADPELVVAMGVAARSAAERWDWSHRAEAYREMYRSLLGGAQRA